jgi:hypothetical protein
VIETRDSCSPEFKLVLAYKRGMVNGGHGGREFPTLRYFAVASEERLRSEGSENKVLPFLSRVHRKIEIKKRGAKKK